MQPQESEPNIRLAMEKELVRLRRFLMFFNLALQLLHQSFGGYVVALEQ